MLTSSNFDFSGFTQSTIQYERTPSKGDKFDKFDQYNQHLEKEKNIKKVDVKV